MRTYRTTALLTGLALVVCLTTLVASPVSASPGWEIVKDGRSTATAVKYAKRPRVHAPSPVAGPVAAGPGPIVVPPAPVPATSDTAPAPPAPAPLPPAPGAGPPAPAPDPGPGPTGSRPWFGVLEATPGHASDLAAAGVGVAHLAVSWRSFEPSPGVVDTGYLASVRARYAAFRAAGLQVVLDLGTQYTPTWVFALPGGTRWVDQYGDAYTGGMGSDVPDAVWNLSVRSAMGAYVARAGTALSDLDWLGVRVGGGPYGELRLPEPTYNGHQDAWWGFGPAAMATNPVPAWRPGQNNPVAAAQFLDWYLASVNGFLSWQLDTYEAAFRPGTPLHVLEPSWGVRPGEIAAAAARSLDGTSRGERRQTLQQGLDWSRQLPVVAAHSGTLLSTTWLDAPDQGNDPAYESPVRYLVRLGTQLGVGVMGENTGNGSPAVLTLCLARARELHLVGMMWMRESDLYAGQLATLSDLGRELAQP